MVGSKIRASQLRDEVLTEAEFTVYSGTLQIQIDNVDTKIDTTSGTLQTQFDSLDLDYATDAELTTTSGYLQDQITSNDGDISTLDTKVDTTSGTLQTQIDAHTTNSGNPHTVTLEQARTAGDAFAGDVDFGSHDLDNVGIIHFDTTLSGHEHHEGSIHWNDDDKCLNIDTEITGVSNQSGQEMWFRATNKTGVTITNGSVLYINGGARTKTNHSSSRCFYRGA